MFDFPCSDLSLKSLGLADELFLEFLVDDFITSVFLDVLLKKLDSCILLFEFFPQILGSWRLLLLLLELIE